MNSKVIVCKSDPYILLYTMTWNYECGIYHIYLKTTRDTFPQFEQKLFRSENLRKGSDHILVNNNNFIEYKLIAFLIKMG